jgi:hypothetical protein
MCRNVIVRVVKALMAACRGIVNGSRAQLGYALFQLTGHI